MCLSGVGGVDVSDVSVFFSGVGSNKCPEVLFWLVRLMLVILVCLVFCCVCLH